MSTSPSMTEIVFAVGRGADLVGRTQFCDFPPEVSAIPEVGGFADPSVEKILALEPTLVCGERGPAGPDLVAALEARGVATFFPAMDDVATILVAIAELGVRVDAATEGARVADAVRQGLDAVRARVAGRPRPRAVFLFDLRPLVAAGPGSFPDELLSIAGTVNVVTAGGKYPRLSTEGLIALDPDVVIDGSMNASAANLAGDELRMLRATRAGRLHRLGSAAALRPGPRLAQGVEELASLAHGAAP